MENMSSCPEGNLLDRPERRRIDLFHFGDGNQTTHNLRGNTVESEVHKAESKCDTQAKTPARNIWLVLGLNDLGLSTHSEASGAAKVYIRPSPSFSFFPAPAYPAPSYVPRCLVMLFKIAEH